MSSENQTVKNSFHVLDMALRINLAFKILFSWCWLGIASAILWMLMLCLWRWRCRVPWCCPTASCRRWCPYIKRHICMWNCRLLLYTKIPKLYWTHFLNGGSSRELMNLTRTIPVIMEAVCIIFQYTYGCWIQTPSHTYMIRNTYSQTFEASSGHDCSV